MTNTNKKLRGLFLAVLMVVSVFAGTIALSGTAAAANESVTIRDQPTQGDSVVVDSWSAGTTGQVVAVWSVDEDGNPDSVLSQVNVNPGDSSTNTPFTGLGIDESQTVAVAVHSGSPAAGNIEALDTARLTVVEGDITDTDTTDAPTYWQGQVVIFDGGDFTAGEEYQLRSVERNDNGNFVVQSPPVQEVRATGAEEVIVRTQNLEGNYVLEDDTNGLAPGDVIGSSLTDYNGFAFEVAVQDLDLTVNDDSVTQGDNYEISLESNRAGYDATVLYNGTVVDNIRDLGNFEDITLNSAGYDIGSNQDLTVDVNDTTATDTDTLTVNEPIDQRFVDSASTFTENSYREQAGDYVNVTIEFEEDVPADDEQYLRTHVVIGSADTRILDRLNVTDLDRDGEATVQLNTFRLARGITPDAGYNASIFGDGVQVDRPRAAEFGGSTDPPDFDLPPTTGISGTLQPSSYEMRAQSSGQINLSQDETALEFPDFSDSATLTLEERSTEEDISIRVAPRGTDFESVENVTSESTLVSSDGEIGQEDIAEEDTVILQINATGLNGYVDDVGDLTSAENGLHLFVTQAEEPADGERYYMDVAGDGELIKDGNNDVYYVILPTENVEGVGSHTGEAPPQTNYQARLVVAGGNFADFYEEGEFPDDANFGDSIGTAPPDAFDFLGLAQHPYLSQAEQEIATGQMTIVDRSVAFDDYVNNLEEIRVSAGEVTMTGTTTIAPGSSFRVSLRNTTAGISEDVLVTVDEDRTWSATVDLTGFSGTAFRAQALEQGVSISSARQASITTTTGLAIPGRVIVLDQATVSMSDQMAEESGSLVTVDEVNMNKGGFVAIHEGGPGGPVIGVSDYLSPGEHSDVEVRLNAGQSLTGPTDLVAMPHKDTNSDRTFDFVATGGDEDGPYVVGGDIVIDTASVAIPTPTATPTDTPTPTPTDTPTPTPTDTPTPTATPTDTPEPMTPTETDEPDTPTPTTTTTGPGFGVVVAVIALLAAALLAARRRE